MRQERRVTFNEDGCFAAEDEWILDTEGVNLLEVMSFPDIDHTRTISNDIVEIIQV
jgi:DNA-directed RNA polymerase II subunit RPB1